MSRLDIEALSKSFGQIHALTALWLSVEDGEFLVLLGPTGAGKTTTLRCVAGLEKPDQGTICMDGEPVDRLTPAERDVAFVFQSYALYPRKTVFENMAFPLQARRLDRGQIEERVKAVARLLVIDGLLERRPAELSGGQQQRVALGRAMVRQPRLFLMDEPLTNLDFMLRVEMRSELKRLQTELNTTFFYVTNDQVEALSMADRVAILNEGRLQQVDKPEAIYDQPANMFVAGFVGNPRMNFLDCRLDAETRTLRGTGWQMALTSQQIAQLTKQPIGDLIFGIRPEDVDLLPVDAPGAMAAEVYVTEPLGDRTIVDLRLGEVMVKVKAAPDFDHRSGDAVGLQMDGTRFHVFDGRSGQTLL
jgi:multiple sugar transport system ATP-binding protein